LNQVPEAHRSQIKAVAMDMWNAYLKAVREVLPQADIVHDRYQISAHLNAAVDRVRKDEHKQLMRIVAGRSKCTTCGRINRVQSVPLLRGENDST
jgi:transposase